MDATAVSRRVVYHCATAPMGILVPGCRILVPACQRRCWQAN